MIAPKPLIEPLIEQAREYVARAAVVDVRRGAPYNTGKICKCGNCFGCAVVKAFDEARISRLAGTHMGEEGAQ